MASVIYLIECFMHPDHPFRILGISLFSVSSIFYSLAVPNIRNIPYPNFFIPLFVSILFPPVFYICVVFNLAAVSAVIISLLEKNKVTQVKCICADIEPHLQILNLHR